MSQTRYEQVRTLTYVGSFSATGDAFELRTRAGRKIESNQERLVILYK